jgi:CheY-like chemotaxis protein
MARILIVENDFHHQEIMKFNLERDGHDVLATDDAMTVVQMLDDFPADLIIMDIALPDVQGIDLTAQIKAHPDLAAIPVLAVTAMTDATLEAAYPFMGFSGYLSKPFRLHDLRQIVCSLLA